MDIDINQAYLKIGKNVKKYRMKKGMSQWDLATQMGYESVSIVSMSEICSRNKHFNIEHLIKISQILEVDIKHLFDGIF